ncbi:SusC/RagA family TonB-linked outer membrane protein [Geofilum sp. OHC36d9]|uniref:SusC/RagA family TonB-linked outer membrane protein n=1 Tax=Geofilum sp. OHC36d9 TaxID=3458413 RepID=UPI0040336D72
MKEILLLKKVFCTFLLLMSVNLGLFSQNITVTGNVTDASGASLPGVNIVLEGTQQGTVSDVDGNYRIEVPADGVLQFNFIGFSVQSLPVNQQSVINVTLQEDLMSLEEVVVVGYGTQRKEAVTGSVASVKGDIVREVPASNITQALQGRVSGVEMSQTSSKPGAEMQIRIRGTRSLNASNDPLVVLNGIPFAGSIGDINPNDIKSIDILKDASATAIYGSRGANGVILITTENGRKGQTAQFTYNGYHGLKTLFARYPMMDGPTFAAMRDVAGKYETDGLDESRDVNTDWQDLLYRNGMVTSHNIGVSGGTEKGNYNFGIGYYKDEAILPGQDFERYSIRGTLEQEIGKIFKVGFTTNSNYSVNNGNNLSLYSTLSNSPIANPYNEDGSLKSIIEMPDDKSWVYTEESIDNLGDKWIDQTRAFGSYNTLYGEVKIPGVEGLKYRINIGLNYRQSNSGNYTGVGVFSGNLDNPSSASISNSHNINWAIENMLTYDRTFAQKHNLNIVALYSAEETKYNKSQISATDIPADHFQFYNLGQAPSTKITIDPDNQLYSESGLMSWMGRAMYSYDNRYMLSVTLRSDGSSRLAEGHKWHTYPAVSAGWNINNESFMESLTAINSLKLRIGYGQTSNQSVDPYKTLGLMSTRPYNFGDTYSTGAYVSELPNDNLGWEYSETMNYGVDFSLLNHRLSGTFEYYVQKTNDILLSVNLPSTSGVSSYYANIGESENKGFEVSLNGVILDDVDGWTWEAGVNLYANRNKLLKLASGQMTDESNWWFVGHPIDVVYDHKKIGIWQEDDPYLLELEGTAGEPGMIKVEYTGDYDENGVPTRQIGADDRQVMSLEPDFQGGFNTRVAYNNFDLSIVGSFKRGGTLISSLYSSSGYLNMLSGRRGNVDVDYWTPQNTGADYPAPGGPTSGDNPKYGSTLGYFDASFLKVRTISLGYNFHQEWMQNMGVDKFRIYCTVQNPFVIFSPYKRESGMDPETNSYGDENAAVSYSENLKRLLTIGTNTPSTRNYLIGINLTF